MEEDKFKYSISRKFPDNDGNMKTVVDEESLYLESLLYQWNEYAIPQAKKINEDGFLENWYLVKPEHGKAYWVIYTLKAPIEELKDKADIELYEFNKFKWYWGRIKHKITLKLINIKWSIKWGIKRLFNGGKDELPF